MKIKLKCIISWTHWEISLSNEILWDHLNQLRNKVNEIVSWHLPQTVHSKCANTNIRIPDGKDILDKNTLIFPPFLHWKHNLQYSLVKQMPSLNIKWACRSLRFMFPNSKDKRTTKIWWKSALWYCIQAIWLY